MMKSLVFTAAVVCSALCLPVFSPVLAVTRYVDGSVSASGDGMSWETAFEMIQEGIDAASDGDTVLVAEGIYVENVRLNGKNIILTSTNPLDLTIVANTIIDGNQSGSVVTFSGAETETCVLSGFTIRNGKANMGGGICGCPSQQQTHATIRNNVVTENSAETGGGVYGCDGTIRNNVVAHNSASRGGGIRYCQFGIIQNNTIVGNSALYSPGGLESCHGIRDCIIWGNVGRAELDVNAIPNYSCVRGWTGNGGGNTSLAPHFVDPDNGDYRVASWSPCIDAGDPASAFSNEPEPNGGRIDMGAYGNTPEATSKSPDADGDQLPDDWERTFFGDLIQNADGDSDSDGIPNVEEYQGGFSPVSEPLKWYAKAAVASSGDGTSWDRAFKTIQEGIDASSDGEVVLVAQGTYVENIQFKGKNIVLAGTNPLNPAIVANTVIDGNQAASVVAFSGSENETCVLKGFTIRNGKSSFGGGIVGGDWGGQTHAVIRNNVVTTNSAADGGGVAYCGGLIEATIVTDNSATGATYSGYQYPGEGGGLFRCDGTIRGNTIAGNKAVYGGGLHSCQGKIEDNAITGNEGGEGGGLFDCDGPISLNTIERNKTVGHSYTDNTGFHVVEPCGGGLAGCDGTIRNNLVTDNAAGPWMPYAETGGGLYRCNGIIELNTICGNHGGSSGGGLSYCNGTIRNNLIIENVSAVDGGGLVMCNGTILNNTIAYNRASLHGGGLYQCKGTISNCIIWGNEPSIGGEQVFDCSLPSYSCIEGWSSGQGQGNVAFEPYFADADLHLSPWSPCIDAGDPASAFGNEPEPNGGRIDMGAYGNTSEATSPSPDADADGLPDGWEFRWFSNLDERPEGDPDSDNIPNLGEYRLGYDPTTKQETGVANVTKRTWHASIQSAITEASDGDEIVVYPGIYSEQVGFDGKNIVLRSADPLDPAIVAATIIDGGGALTIVRFLGSEGESCVLAGFTIRNGGQLNGMESAAILGGTGASRTHAIIRNNVIRGTGADGVYYCDGIIEDNAIENNEGSGVAYCGAQVRNNTITGSRSIAGLYYCSGLIEGNLIEGNFWNAGCGGLAYCHGTIRGNVIRNNSYGGICACNGTVECNLITANAGPGLYGCNGIIRNNIISGNAALRGAGLYGCNGEIINNTITGNVASGWVSHGGGLANCKGNIVNCIIWGNRAPARAQLSESGVPSYSCIQGWREGGAGNISSFPYFVDPGGGDYHLHTWSPCVDAGDPSSDFSNEPLPNGGRIDMGAYGNTSEATSSSPDIDADGLPDDWEISFFSDLRWGESDDPDGDGWLNSQEYQQEADPTRFAIWYVDGAVPASGVGTSWQTAFKTMQEGIDIAQQLDVVIVAEGTYKENIRFPGRDIALTSVDPLNLDRIASTIIDGQGRDSTVTFFGLEGEACALRGFTIRNGSGTEGGGVAGNGTQATIQRNVIANNHSAEDGGGLNDCDGLIENNDVVANSATWDGGGVYGCDGTVRNNWVISNSGGDRGGGMTRCHGTIQGNIIAHNSAYGGGGLSSCDGDIYHNTIVGNSASSPLWSGGGLFECKGKIVNCVVWGNTAYLPGQLYESAVPMYSCVQGWTGAGEGNLASEPKLADPDGPDNNPATWKDNDFRLSPDSPCVDAGMNEDWMWSAVDLDGNPRVWKGTVDMGAYEYGSWSFRISQVLVETTGGLQLTWTSRLGDEYVIWSSGDLTSGTWTQEQTVPSAGDSTSWTDPSPTGSQKFYRIELQ